MGQLLLKISSGALKIEILLRYVGLNTAKLFFCFLGLKTNLDFVTFCQVKIVELNPGVFMEFFCLRPLL